MGCKWIIIISRSQRQPPAIRSSTPQLASSPLLRGPRLLSHHYNDVIMSAMASQITSLMTVYPTVYSGADQRQHQSSASLAFVRRIHRWPVNSPHKWPVIRKNVSIWWRHRVTRYFLRVWDRGWAMKPILFVPPFSGNSPLSKHWLPINHHVHILLVPSQLRCGDTLQLRKWFKYHKEMFAKSNYSQRKN